MKLADAKVVITGGSSGIGKELARQLVEIGASTLITAPNEQRLLAAAEETKALSVVADVSQVEGIESTFAAIASKLGGLDILINNAGIGYSAPLVEVEPKRMEEVWRVNVLGATMMAQRACSEYFIPNKSGAIVNVASTAALKGYAGGTSYSSSKFALRSLSECWRSELRQFNIRVMNICPSEVTTAFGSSQRIERAEESNKLRSKDIVHCILSTLELDERGFIPELSIFATNPF